MYTDFYNLRECPFHVTPNPAFLYLSPSHQEALATIIYGVEQGKGFIVLMGEVGLGKTTLLQAFMKDRDRSQEKIIYLYNSHITFMGLLRTLARELDLEAGGDEPQAFLDPIYQALIREYAQGNNVVLLIDEAQGMPMETLEGLRMISNLETATEKLIQIVLVGQPELKNTLDQILLRQLKQRIAVQAILSPLTRQESLEYIQFRIKLAGGRAETIFSRQALDKIICQAKGTPRSINILCDNGLITGFGYRQKPVSVQVINEVIKDLCGCKIPLFPRWVPALLSVFFILLSAWGLSVYYHPHSPGAMVFNPASHSENSVSTTVAATSPAAASPHPPSATSIPPAVTAIPVTGAPMPVATASGEAHQAPTDQEIGPPATVETPTASESQLTKPGENTKRFLVAKTVQTGDTLSRLTLEAYGVSNPILWNLVRKYNPRIKADLKIRIGEKILFPEQ